MRKKQCRHAGDSTFKLARGTLRRLRARAQRGEAVTALDTSRIWDCLTVFKLGGKRYGIIGFYLDARGKLESVQPYAFLH